MRDEEVNTLIINESYKAPKCFPKKASKAKVCTYLCAGCSLFSFAAGITLFFVFKSLVAKTLNN